MAKPKMMMKTMNSAMTAAKGMLKPSVEPKFMKIVTTKAATVVKRAMTGAAMTAATMMTMPGMLVAHAM
jgi:hypothetical protein